MEEQTATTNEMTRNVAEAATGAGQIAANITGVAEAAGTTTSGVADAARAAAGLARVAADLQQLITGFHVDDGGSDDSVRARLEKAIAAHAMWKARLRDAVDTGRSDADPASARVDNACTFGRWLYEGSTAQERRSPHYSTCRTLHARFHRAAASILELALAGRTTQAREALEPHSEFGVVCIELTEALSAWKHDTADHRTVSA